MTPLAQQLLNDWCLPLRDRQVKDPHGVLPQMVSAKCFECSALGEFVTILARDEPANLFESGRIFAPAPVTFIEVKTGQSRLGLLIIEQRDGSMRLYLTNNLMIGMLFVGVLQSSTTSNGQGYWFRCGEINREDGYLLARGAAYYLFLINTPKLLGNITRLPHSGLQRKLAHAQGMTGKFPLLAWTEITLWVTPNGSKAEAENREIEAHLSGRKCLHFVRAFLRWRLGKLEIVRSHWKGDGSLGIKRSRYKMAA
ncbi:MAG: hypothetical protein EOS73_29395 [Mesorhizobium sp.]|uniref:hypothetical protein n=1 Tax=Mesorhizobium sp. M7A.F.Ca.ET.027.02.1.1 TaxID=2496655 RepID=UPI000FD4DE62|nr:hypothetical protein [Mesorhizobium sp. M7A.F.Ca.ET.027.02.1.1]RVD09569.1 hypothetical protein EN749_32275 [Mesorhizobium sp. M7A.F.Ca.ET.027.02.1.1]RWC98976.1 MAG: hypothetical protein EOS73_29395 [Mesorhizobium sp.]